MFNKSNLFYDCCMICVSLRLAISDIFCVKFLLALTIDHWKYISCTAWTYIDRCEVVRWLPACILCVASPLFVCIDFVKCVCNFFVDLFLCVK